MRRKILIIAIAIPLLLLLTSVSYTCIKNYCAMADATQLYRAGLQNIYSKDNQFTPQAELDFYDSLLKTATTQDLILGIHAYRSITLLKMGKEKDATEVLEALLRTNQENSEKMYKRLRENLALAYLRMAERNNCLSNHSSGSCIFPIQGKGIYTDPYASQKSIQAYETILKKDSSDLTSRWLLNIAYMTIGEYPSNVPVQWLIPGLDSDTSSFKLKAFREMAGDLQLNGPGNMAGGAIVDDFNNDGYLDIVTSGWGLEESMHYYRNNADGTFTDLSKESGLSAIKGGLNIIQADYNNDGYTDILVLRGAWMQEFGKQPNTLLRNNGDGTYTDVTTESGILSFHPTQTATWADFNNDGWLDLFIGNETSSPAFPHPAELYINNQDGTFTNVAAEAGCDERGFTKGVIAGDYNNDGWPDIFMSERDGHKILLKNKAVKGRIPQFENTTMAAGLGGLTYTFPTWFWDYDNDGWPDIFASGYPNGGSMAWPA